MDPNEFVSEVYRRMAARLPGGGHVLTVQEFDDQAIDTGRVDFYRGILPADKNCRIVDVGAGDGGFLSICNMLGYRNLTAVDFRAAAKFKDVCAHYPHIGAVDLRNTVGDHFGLSEETFDVIHFSHVIEHFPKYTLLYVVDALYKALNKGGLIIVRTPNMEGPFALSSYYVTLSHEYGFGGANLRSLLHICGFDQIQFHEGRRAKGLRQKIGRVLRWPYLANQRLKNRLFGVNRGGRFDAELVVTARRGEWPPYFDAKYK